MLTPDGVPQISAELLTTVRLALCFELRQERCFRAMFSMFSTASGQEEKYFARRVDNKTRYTTRTLPVFELGSVDWNFRVA